MQRFTSSGRLRGSVFWNLFMTPVTRRSFSMNEPILHRSKYASKNLNYDDNDDDDDDGFGKRRSRSGTPSLFDDPWSIDSDTNSDQDPNDPTRVSLATSSLSKSSSSSSSSSSRDAKSEPFGRIIWSLEKKTYGQRRHADKKKLRPKFQRGDFMCPRCGTHNTRKADQGIVGPWSSARRALQEGDDTKATILLTSNNKSETKPDQHSGRDSNAEIVAVSILPASPSNRADLRRPEQFPLGALSQCIECGYETTLTPPRWLTPKSRRALAQDEVSESREELKGGQEEHKQEQASTQEIEHRHTYPPERKLRHAYQHHDLRMSKPRDYVCQNCKTVNFRNRTDCAGCGDLAPWLRKLVERGVTPKESKRDGSDSSIMSSSAHIFHEKTFSKLTYCDYCTKCSELVYNNCVRSMYIPSHDDQKASSVKPRTLSLKRKSNEGMRVSIPPAIVSSSQPLQTLEEKSVLPKTQQQKQQQQQQETIESPVAGRSSFLEDAIIAAAIRMSLPGDISALPKNDHPPLTIQATTINFTRFVHKTTGLFWFQDRVEDIFTWKDPWNTTFVLVLYCFVCIYPMLLFLLPQCIMATIMIYFFQQKSARQQQKILNIRPSGKQVAANNPVDTIPAEEEYIAAQEKAHHNRHHVYHEEDYLDKPSSSESDLEENEQERRSLAVQYLSNLQHIQNMMGDVSDAHDVLRPMFSHLDWSDEAEAIMIVQVTMAAFVGMSVVMWFVPWRWVFMVGGASGMLANSPWGKVVTKELGPLGKDIAAWVKVNLQEFKKSKMQDM
ncbi:hypothetical protein BGZ94_005125 [Podila epigama]|nr:hypothetical protein BGZ94_005125 [Podila epigama]